MITFVESISRWVVEYYVLATALLAGTLLFGMATRQPARWISLSWAVTIGLIALAVVTALPRFTLISIPIFDGSPRVTAPVENHGNRIRHEPSEPVLSIRQSSPTIRFAERNSTATLPESLSDSIASQAKSHGPNHQVSLIMGFAVVSCLILSWQTLGAVLTIRLRRMSHLAPKSVQFVLSELWSEKRSVPVVLVTDAINQALANGVLNPVILLPARFERQESASSLQAVLAHEASHVLHRDLWLRALQRWLVLILYAHPLFWLLRAITHANQEYLADATARGEEPLNYAEILLHWFRTSAASRNTALTASVGLWGRPHLLKRRISMVLNENFEVEQNSPAPWKATAWSIVAICVVVLSCISLYGPAESFAQEESSVQEKSSLEQSPSKASAKKNRKKTAKPKVESKEPAAQEVQKTETEVDKLQFSEAQIAKAKAKYTSADEAYGVGVAYYNSRNFAASREPFEAALMLGKDQEDRLRIYGTLMASYRLLPNIEPFVTVCEYIIKYSERDAEQSLTRGALLSFLHERGKLDPFIQRHEDRLKNNPKDRLSLYLLSEVYTRLREDPERSIQLLKQLAEVDGKNSDDAINVQANAKLAAQYIRAKEYLKGAELYEKIAPQDKSLAAWHWKEAATAWIKLKNTEKALAAAAQSARSDPEARSELLTHFWHRNLADVYMAAGEPKLAIPHFEMAIKKTNIEGYIKECNASLVEARAKAGDQ